MFCIILFFSTALARLPEFIADILWMVVTVIGYIFGFVSLLKKVKIAYTNNSSVLCDDYFLCLHCFFQECNNYVSIIKGVKNKYWFRYYNLIRDTCIHCTKQKMIHFFQIDCAKYTLIYFIVEGCI